MFRPRGTSAVLLVLGLVAPFGCGVLAGLGDYTAAVDDAGSISADAPTVFPGCGQSSSCAADPPTNARPGWYELSLFDAGGQAPACTAGYGAPLDYPIGSFEVADASCSCACGPLQGEPCPALQLSTWSGSGCSGSPTSNAVDAGDCVIPTIAGDPSASVAPLTEPFCTPVPGKLAATP